MSAERPTNIAGIILERAPYGESYIRFSLFSAEHGLIRLLKRASTNKTTPMPDLFDEIEAVIDYGKANGPGFLKDFTVAANAETLARKYDNFMHACQFCRVLADNLNHFADFAAAYELLHNSLGAWIKLDRGEIVHFKSLYLLARAEGYPVKEQWWHSLHREDQHNVATLLKTPTEEILLPKAVVTRHLNNLRFWLAVHTDFIVKETASG